MTSTTAGSRPEGEDVFQTKVDYPEVSGIPSFVTMPEVEEDTVELGIQGY